MNGRPFVDEVTQWNGGRLLARSQPARLPPPRAPQQFELVVNLKTAKALGITIPQSLRLRAEEIQ